MARNIFFFFYRKLHAVINPIFPFYFLLALHMELAHVSLFMCLCEKDRKRFPRRPGCCCSSHTVSRKIVSLPLETRFLRFPAEWSELSCSPGLQFHLTPPSLQAPQEPNNSSLRIRGSPVLLLWLYLPRLCPALCTFSLLLPLCVSLCTA